MTPTLLLLLAFVSFVLFILVAAFDATWFHFHRVRIHERPEMRAEHWLHTANACLFPVTIAFLYAGNFAGGPLLVALAAVGATYVLELVDVGYEKVSRRDVGGVSAAESTLHFAMGLLRATSTAFLVASKPGSAFSWHAPWALSEPYPSWMLVVGRTAFVASLPMAAMHLVHVRWPPLRTRAA